MAIKLACPNPDCGKTLNAGDGLAGRRVKCPACGEPISVPGVDERRPVKSGTGLKRGPRSDEDWEDEPRRKRPPRDDDEEAPRKRTRRDDDGNETRRPAPRPATGLSGLTGILFFVGLACLLVLGISSFFPWASMNVLGMSMSVRGTETTPGLLILILSPLFMAFALVAFFVGNGALFKASVWSSFAWSLAAAVISLLNIINGRSVGSANVEVSGPKKKAPTQGFDMPDFDIGDLTAKAGKVAEKAGLGDMGPKIGLGLWLALVFAALAAATLGFVAVRSLFGGSPAPRRERRDDQHRYRPMSGEPPPSGGG